MSVLIDIVKFIAGIFLLFYIPGHFLVGIIGKKWSVSERITLSFVLGIFIIPQAYYYLEHVRLHGLFLGAVIICGVLYSIYMLCFHFIRRKKEIHSYDINIKNGSISLVAIILVVIVAFALLIGTSGTLYKDGMRFYQANAYDSVAQLSMVEELSKNPPHEFPFYSGLSFRGYYVGSFYWRALIQKISGLNSVDLFFRYCPLILFPLIIMMVFVSIKKITGSKHVALLATFLIFLMSDLSWVFPIVDRLLPFKGIDTVNFSGSLLRWIMFNPPFAHGVLVFFTGCYFLKHSSEEKDSQGPSWIPMFLAGMLLGSLFEYKAFIWATVFPALFLVSIKEYFFERKTRLLKITLIAGIFSVISFFRVSSSGTLSLFRFSLGHRTLSLFFLIGVLGIKIIGFQKIYQSLKKWKTRETIHLFLIIAMTLSFILTNILVFESDYSGATYNFFAIFLLCISLFAAESLIDFTKNAKFLLKKAIFLIIFVIGIGSTAFSFLAYFPEYSKYKVVSRDSLAAMDYIKKNSQENAVVLHSTDTRYWISAKTHKKIRPDTEGRDSFVSALTARRAVLDCSWHMAMGAFSPEVNRRKNEVRLFFRTKNRKQAKDILNKYNVSYVLVDHGKDLNFETREILKKVFDNKKASVYEVVQK